MSQLDGLLFTGGGDIDPKFYNETAQVDNLGHIQLQRDELELTLMHLAMKTAKPFLAICRGIQIMNVANGGNLWQDLTQQQPHAMRHDYFSDSNYPRNHIAHDVILEKKSLLANILQSDCVAVNSLHHQSPNVVPPTLKATGYAEDKVIEVLEAVDHPFGLGVQWHPEELVAERETARKIFAAFVHTAGNSPN